MEIEEYVYDKLINDATLSALISDRVYPNIRPQDQALPCIVYVDVTQGKNINLKTPVFAIKGIAETRSEVDQIRRGIEVLFTEVREQVSDLSIDQADWTDSITIVDSNGEGFLSNTDVFIHYRK